jgi:putative ABC transport system permease protein
MRKLGRNFELYGRTGPIIGVVQDFHYKSLREKIPPMAFDMLPWWYNEIIIRTTPGVPPPLPPSKRFTKDIYQRPLFSSPLLMINIADIYEAERKLLSYNSILALLMILISALGLSSLSYLIIGSRIKEIGIRKINGATLEDIFMLLAGNFGKWILVAIFIAIPSACSLSNNGLAIMNTKPVCGSVFS